MSSSYRYLYSHLACTHSIYQRDFSPADDLSPYKQTENAILMQTIGRFRMDASADATTIHIDQDILEKDRCLKKIQFEGRSLGYEMNMIVDAADIYYRNQFTRSSAEFNKWNTDADSKCQIYTKNLLPAAKSNRDLAKIKDCIRTLEAMKIAASTGGISRNASKVWLNSHPHLQKGLPVRITQKDIWTYSSLFWKKDCPHTAMSPASFSKILYEPLDLLKDIMPEGAARIRAKYAPLFYQSFASEVRNGNMSFSMSSQGAGFLKGEIGESFAEEIFRYAIDHGGYSEFHIYSSGERLSKPFIYQYEDFDGILAPNVFWDAKNISGDLLILGAQEAADTSDDPFAGPNSDLPADMGNAFLTPTLSELEKTKDPEVVRNALKNKIGRMPKGQMNYLIYFSTRFIGTRKPPKFYTPKNNRPLRKLCKETGRNVTIVVVSSLFTEEDTTLTRTQKHNRIMTMIGRRVLGRILEEMETERK